MLTLPSKVCIKHLSRLMGKPSLCIGKNEGTDQLRTLIRNFKLLALFLDYTGRFVLDLFGNYIVGFPTRWLN